MCINLKVSQWVSRAVSMNSCHFVFFVWFDEIYMFSDPFFQFSHSLTQILTKVWLTNGAQEEKGTTKNYRFPDCLVFFGLPFEVLKKILSNSNSNGFIIPKYETYNKGIVIEWIN